ncbi:unnamed protein product, partial [Amoebophrya sp. A25]|eukprot:GSA25T00026904001.1
MAARAPAASLGNEIKGGRGSGSSSRGQESPTMSPPHATAATGTGSVGSPGSPGFMQQTINLNEGGEDDGPGT